MKNSLQMLDGLLKERWVSRFLEVADVLTGRNA